MSIALITDSVPPYRIPLYSRLSNEPGIEFFFHRLSEDAQASYFDAGGVPVEYRPALKDLPFRATTLDRPMDAMKVAGEFDTTIATITGRSALPAAYLGARRKGKRFVLWASMWRHPRTAFHLASALPMRQIYRHADAVIAYGPHVAQYVGRFRRDGIFIAPQAVDRDLFSRKIPESEKNRLRTRLGLEREPIVLFVGRLTEEKGVHVLLEAWRTIRHRTQARLVMAGEGPLTQAATEAGAVVTGRLPYLELPALYAVAGMLVLPSITGRLFAEPWGNVVNEAMHQGIVPITSDAVGAARGGLVRSMKNGIVVPEKDPAALAAAIVSLLENRDLGERLGRQAAIDVERMSYDAAAEGFRRAIRHAEAPREVPE